jgi:hypothetical protein
MRSTELLATGDEVLIVFERDGVRQTEPALVRAQGGQRLDVCLREGRAMTGTPVGVIAGGGHSERFAQVQAFTRGGDCLSLTALGSWRTAVHRRGTQRFPTFMPCWLEADGFVANGRCLDLSMRGAAVETHRWEQKRFILRLPWGDGFLHVPSEAVSIESMLGIVVVHTQFAEMPAESAAPLRDLVTMAHDEFLEAQRHLAGRCDDLPPAHSTARLG